MTTETTLPLYLSDIRDAIAWTESAVDMCRQDAGHMSYDPGGSILESAALKITDPSRLLLQRSHDAQSAASAAADGLERALGQCGNEPQDWSNACARMLVDLMAVENPDEPIISATFHGSSNGFRSASVMTQRPGSNARMKAALGPQDVGELMALSRFAMIATSFGSGRIGILVDDVFSISAFRSDLDPAAHARLVRDASIPAIPVPSRAAERIWG